MKQTPKKSLDFYIGTSLFIGIFISISLYLVTKSFEDKELKAYYSKTVEHYIFNLQQEILLNKENLLNLQGFFTSSKHISREAFQHYTKPLLARNQSIQSLAWLPFVKANERAMYETKAHNDGLLDFSFKTLKGAEIILENKQDYYFPVFYVEPFLQNLNALGLNHNTIKNRQEVLNDARRSHAVRISNHLKLLEENRLKLVFLMYLPVYENLYQENEKGNILGFIVGSFRLEDIIDSATKKLGLEEKDFLIKIEDTTNDERQFLYMNRIFSPKKFNEHFTFTKTLNIENRSWRITFLVSHESIQKKQQTKSFIMLLIFLSFTTLVIYVIYLLKKSKEDLEHFNNYLEYEVEQKSLKVDDTLKTINQHLLTCKTDFLGTIKYTSRALCSFSSYQRAKLHNQHIKKLIPTINFTQMVQEVMENGNINKELILLTKHNKERFIYSSISHEKNDLIFIFQDVTSQKLLEEQKIKGIRQSKHAAMGEMIAMIAHQWRQPLSTINSISSNLKVQNELGTLTEEKLDSSVEEVFKHTAYLSQTINDFRNFFKSNKEMEKASVSEIVKNSNIFLSHLIKTTGTRFIYNHASNQTIAMYKNEILQVIINILKNALDEIKEKRVKDPCIVLEDFVKENINYIIIQDNAGGIEDKILENIFNPYFSTKGENGTGLGLYMSKIIIEKHHKGQIKVRNQGHGAEFTIMLPIDN